ncbi:MAG: DinB family protein [Bryobacteraceae bacterium]
MHRAVLLTFAATIGCLSLAAQPAAPNSLTTEGKQLYTAIKNNLIKAAEKMPEESYAFKASPDIRTFGALIGHIADTQMRYCGAALGEQKSVDAASKTSKADLVAALKSSFDFCDKAWDGTTDANATQTVGAGRMQLGRLTMLMRNTIHDNEEYGYLAVYLRLKGVVPPSSDRSAR